MGKINHMPTFLKGINWCIRYILLPVYPLVFGGLVVWTKFVERSSLFFDIVTGQEDQQDKVLADYDADPATIWLWASLGIWLLLYIYSEIIKNVEDEIKLHRLMSKNPKPEVSDKAKEYFEDLNNQFRELSKWEHQFQAYVFNEEQTKLLKEKIILIGITIRQIAHEFFGIKTKNMAAKFMIFIDYSKEQELVNALIEKAVSEKSIVYNRSKNESLLGILYPSPDVSSFLEDREKESDFLIPIYQRNSRVYNPSSPYDDKTILGAPTAFFDNSSLISDTRSKSSYVDFDSITQDEILLFFKETCPKIKSVLSFRVPTNEFECVALFNLEASKTNTFGVPEYLLESFEIIISPFLVLVLKYLKYYHYYQFTNLKNDLNIEHIHPRLQSYSNRIE